MDPRQHVRHLRDRLSPNDSKKTQGTASSTRAGRRPDRPPRRARLGRFNERAFCAFQIQDDILTTWKPGAIRQGDWGRSLRGQADADVGSTCSSRASQEKRKLQDLLGRQPRRLPREIDWVYELLRRYGSIEFAQTRARELLAAAETAFEQTYESAPESDDKAFLAQSLRYMIDRRS
jgi:geranylgeranyl pyrophosphate synthase